MKNTRSSAVLPFAAFTLGALLAGVLSYRFLDKRLAYYFRAIPLKQKKAVDWVGGLSSPEFALTTAGVLLGYGAYQLQAKQKPAQHLWPFAYVPASVGVAYLLKKSLKYLITRKRPLVLFVDHNFGFEWFASGEKQEQSFPSGHALSFFALLHAASLSWPQLAVPLHAGGWLLIGTRVAVTDHYLSDILAGAWLGVATSEALYAGLQKTLDEAPANLPRM